MADILTDKVAIVTGSGRGVGRGVARLMAQEGAQVVVVDPGVNVDGSGYDQSIAEQVVAEIRQEGGQAVACMESVATMEGGEKIVQTAIDNFGKLDIVVTCAGILRDRMIFNMTEQEWDDVIAVHLKGTFSVVKNACILFRQQRSGRIITFSSQSGLQGNSGQANYGAAKSGIAGFTKVVARDMGRYGVTANSIAPRATTRMIGAIPDSAAEIRARGGVQTLDQGNEPETMDPRRHCALRLLPGQRLRGQRQRSDLPGLRQRNFADVPAQAGAGHLQRGPLVHGRHSPQARNHLTRGIYNPAPPRA